MTDFKNQLEIVSAKDIRILKMKDKYFTKNKIEKKSLRMLTQVKKLRENHPLEFTPKNSVLLILDMQDYFIKESSHAYIPSAPTIIPKIKKIAKVFAEKKYPVIFTKHLNNKRNSNNMSSWWKEIIKEDNSLSNISKKLPVSTGTVIRKSQYSAFYKTSLEKNLKEKGIKQVVICGVMTHLCCETTARDAFMRGFEVFFTIDATATYNEKFHNATLINLSHGFAYPVLIKELIDSF